jgi:nitrate reductase alpha subunit
VWESKSDWVIFREIARVTSELAKTHFNKPIKDVVNTPIAHDTAGEIAQRNIKDWSKGECEPIPGKTMHNIVVTERDYTKIYDKYICLGPNMKTGLGGHGIKYDSTDFYEQMLEDREHVRKIEGVEYPSIYEDAEAANAVLRLSSVTNGELAHRAYKFAEKKTGVALTDLSEGSRNVRMNYKDLLTRPHRYHNSPIWSGLMANGRAYSGYTYNVERLVPWRTLTGRQHFYLDHEGYIKFGEHMPTYKPSPRPEAFGELRMTIATGKAKMLNVLTPHGKWHIHSTFGDTQIMLTLSRGMEPCWLSEEDAEELGIKDNDWVEVFNDNGVYSARACVSARIPKGVCFVYHAVERTYSTPKSQVRGGRRSGMNNSLTRVHLKPNLMMGGYGQFTYAVNYWGPVGTNRDTFVLVQKMDKVEF